MSKATAACLQHAGTHLQQMAKEIKSGNVGSLFSEIKRRTVGGGGVDLSGVVHASLKESASLLSANVTAFGKTVEALLTKHRRGIVGECA